MFTNGQRVRFIPKHPSEGMEQDVEFIRFSGQGRVLIRVPTPSANRVGRGPDRGKPDDRFRLVYLERLRALNE